MNKIDFYKKISGKNRTMISEAAEAYDIEDDEVIDYLMNQDRIKEHISDVEGESFADVLFEVLLNEYPYENIIKVFIRMVSGIEYNGSLQTGYKYMRLSEVLKHDVVDIFTTDQKYIEINTKMIECYHCSSPVHIPDKQEALCFEL